MDLNSAMFIYVVAFAFIVAAYLSLRGYAEARSRAKREQAEQAGLSEPVSLHPTINAVRCLGCGACVRACPEGDVLGLINGRAELIGPSDCVGHGACKQACPHDAISLVFGTEARGVDIPHVGPDFQTNVPGIFVAGELGGMGLIRNAIEQGSQAVAAIRKRARQQSSRVYDLVIVGAGPAGFAASLAAIQHGLRYRTVEQDSFGGTVAHYPRGKLVTTAPAILPLVGKLKLRRVSKEELLRVWENIARKTGVKIHYNEQVRSITQRDREFEIATTKGSYLAASVLLAVGRRGTPRRLDIEGEGQTKVVYRLVDAHQYRQQHVLVVGGGDSALEAAASVAEQPGTTVTLAHRGVSFSRARAGNRERIEAAERSGRVRVLRQSRVHRIGRHHVDIEHDGRRMKIRNDAVIVCAGGILPTAFLKSIGVAVETKYGTE